MPDETDEAEKAQVEMLLQVLPVSIRVEATFHGVVFSLLPWGAPALFGWNGTTKAGEPLLVLAYEWPIPWLRVRERLTKQEIEAFHLTRFSTDFRLASGGLLPFGANDAGGDPPDFVVTTDAGLIGVDCTAFALPQRRHALSLFGKLKGRLAALNPAAFAHLGGFMLYVWFEDEPSAGLPFRRGDDEAADELLAALFEYRPDPEQLVVGGNAIPDQLPPMGKVQTPSGATFYAVPMQEAMPDTVFAAMFGFELGLGLTTEHSPVDSWGEIRRLIESHDKRGVDWLLVSAGAPGANGMCFGSEEAVLRQMLDSPEQIDMPEHIKRVTVHLWSAGEAYELLPATERLFGPLYRGVSPSHRPLDPEWWSPD